MKVILLLWLPIMVFSLNTYGQPESEKKPASTTEINRFYYFEIPASINGSNIDPSPISNVTSNFTDSKLSLKLGFPSLFKNAPESKDLTNTGFLQAYAKATNGVATLWKANSQPTEFGFNAGFSHIICHSYWVALDKDQNETDEHTSEAIMWINIIGSLERGNYNLFNPAGDFGGILKKQTETNGSIYLSFNRYFFSKLFPYRLWSCIWSVGAGYAKTNNYTSLKSRTYQEGRIVYNDDSSFSQTVVETTAGRNGPMTISEGLTAFGEIYFPLLRNKKYGSLYFGNRLTIYSIGGTQKITNGNTGFYVNLKDKKVENDKPAKDVVNFSITAQFNQLNKIGKANYNYMDDNFSVLLQASLPIRFN